MDECDLLTLSQHLGFIHYDYLLDSLTASQLEDWLAWMRRYHPFPNRNDRYYAMLLSAWYEDTRPEDFMIYEPEEELTSDELADRISSLIPKSKE